MTPKEKVYLDAIEKCAAAFTEIMKIPDCPEKGPALHRVTEAGMWVRMALDMERSPEPVVKLKPKAITHE